MSDEKKSTRENWREQVSQVARARRAEVKKKKTFIKTQFNTLSFYHHHVIKGKRMDTFIVCGLSH